MKHPITASPSMRSAPRTHQQKQLDRLQVLVTDFAHPDVEMLAENVAPIVATFRALRRTGYPVDPILSVIMDKLGVQLFEGAEVKL